MPFSVEFIRKLEKTPPELKEVLLALLEEVERQREESVTKKEFQEFVRHTDENFRKVWQSIRELTEAQKKTEQKVSRLEKVVEELAEAQKKSEERLTRVEKAVEELAEAQKRTEQRVNELAEAQKETQKEVSRLDRALQELAEAQKRTEEKVNELAEAQKRTEQELRELIGEHRKTREQLGGVTHTVGYVLEDRAYRGLPELLKRDFGVDIIASLKRDYIEVSPGRYEEVNIIGKGRRNGKEVLIIGECKTQLKRADIDAFVRLVRKLEGILEAEKILIAVTYQASPPVRRYAEQKGIKLYFSYEMPL